MSPQRPKFQLNLFERNPATVYSSNISISQRFGGVKLNFRNMLGFLWRQKNTYLQAESIFYGYIYIYMYAYTYIYIQYTIFYDIICQPSVLDDHEAVASQKIVCCM